MNKELEDTGLHCRGRGFNCHSCDKAKFCSEYIECEPLKHEAEANVKYYFSDDEYIHWFECTKCRCNRIVYKSNYCPSCGNKLNWTNVIENDNYLKIKDMKNLSEEKE